MCVYLELNLHGMLTLRRSTRRYIGLRSTQLMTEIASTNSNVGTVVPGFDAEVSQNLKYTVVIGEKGRSKKSYIVGRTYADRSDATQLLSCRLIDYLRELQQKCN